MSTLNPNILLAQQQYKLPDFNMGETLTNIARLKAYQQSQRLEELKYGQAERAYARDEDFQRLASQLFTPDQPAAPTPPRGLAGGSPPLPGGPPPPAPGGLAMPQGAPAQGPGPWAGGYQMPGEPPGGLAMAQPGMPPAGAPPPAMGGTGGIPAPTSMEPGTSTMAQGGPQPPQGLAAPPPPPAAPPPAGLPAGHQAPPAPPGGLGGAQPAEPKPLLPQMNERVMAQLYAANPEKAAKLIGGQLDLQGKKLEQTEKMNDQIHQVLSALQASPNPAAMYPQALNALRERGIPIPASFPKEYNAGLMAFKLREHETLKSRLEAAKVEVERVRALHVQEQAKTEQAQQQLHGATTELKKAETGAVPSQIALRNAQEQHALAQTAREKQAKGLDLNKDERDALTNEEALLTSQQKRQLADVSEKHEVAMRPLRVKEQELKNRYEGIRGDTALSEEERKAKLAPIEQELKVNELEQKRLGVPEYVKGEGAYNAALGEIMKRKGLTGTPGAAEMQEARNQVVADKVAVSGAHGREGAMGAVVKDVLMNASAKGQSGEQVHATLDDIEDLMGKGVLSSKWEEAWRMYAQSAGLRPDDEAAARTWAMKNMGDQLTLAMAGGKLGGQISDADRELIARASGGMGGLLSPAQQKLAVEQLRRLADRDVEFGNRHIKQYNETKSLPEYGQVRKERLAKTITPAKFDEALAARPGITRPQLRKWFDDNGYIVRAD